MEIKPVKTRFTKASSTPSKLTRRAFLDALYDEAVEDPYAYTSMDEAVADLSGRYKLSLDEVLYLKKKAKDGKVKFVEKNRR